ncbi:MAG: hypothetical protein NZL88_11915, partial [Gaiellaceae bacterium]|nr:hypothetical protein [Gaiellaceae bacterium]
MALAWQTAARQLKFSQPEVYAELNRRVLELLETSELRDPADELEALRGERERLLRELAWQEEEYARCRETLREREA